jgi:hypothetical protein
MGTSAPQGGYGGRPISSTGAELVVLSRNEVRPWHLPAFKFPLKYSHLPDERLATIRQLETRAAESLCDRRRRVNVAPEGSPLESENKVHDADHHADYGMIARVHRTIESPRFAPRLTHQAIHVGIATDDAVERDEVSGIDLTRNIDEVTEDEPDSLAVPPSISFLSCDRDEIGRDVDVNGIAHRSVDQLVVEDSDAAPMSSSVSASSWFLVARVEIAAISIFVVASGPFR